MTKLLIMTRGYKDIIYMQKIVVSNGTTNLDVQACGLHFFLSIPKITGCHFFLS